MQTQTNNEAITFEYKNLGIFRETWHPKKWTVPTVKTNKCDRLVLIIYHSVVNAKFFRLAHVEYDIPLDSFR